MLLSKGINSIINALCEGSSVSSLYLKGNNISGQVVEQLGRMLLHNNTLKTLSIEWNSLGSQVDSFSKFCAGLSRNHNVEELDLRYNQLSSRCAEPLSKALRSNQSLKSVDLSWNSLGLQGAQEILSSLDENRTMVRLNLRGNCVPSDTIATIEEALSKNRNRKTTTICRLSTKSIKPRAMKNLLKSMDAEVEENKRISKENVRPSSSEGSSDGNPRTRPRYPRKKVRRKERTKTPIEENPAGDSFEGAKELNESDAKTLDAQEKIEVLDRILSERTATIESLKSELEGKTTELDGVKSEREELRKESLLLKEEKERYTNERAKEIEDLKKLHAQSEESWCLTYKELEESHRKTLKAKSESEGKNRTFERDLRKSGLETVSLREKLSSSTQAFEDLISEGKTEVHRLKRELRERENRSKIESTALKESLKETTDALEKCQAQLQKSRNELREANEAQVNWKVKCEEAERLASRTLRLEEALQRSREEKEAADEKTLQSRKSMASLQRQLVVLREEALEPQRKREAMQAELELEREKAANLRKELHEERARARENDTQMQTLSKQVAMLNLQIGETQSCNAETLRVKDKEAEKLKDQIARKSQELEELR